MNLQFMHVVDYWVGIPLCAVLSIVERVRARVMPAVSAPPRRMLLIELSEMGSAVLAYPAIREAVDRLGADNVWFMIFERNREGVEVLGILPRDHIITVSDRSFPSFLTTLSAALRRCRRERLDAAVDLEIFSRCTALLTWLSGARRRAGLSAGDNEGLYRGFLFTHPVLYSPHHHMTRTYLTLVRATFADAPAGEPLSKEPIGDVPPSLPEFRASADVVASVDHLVSGLPSGTRLVFLNPDAGLLPLRAWPTAHFAALARLLVDADPAVVVAVTGVERTRALGDEILTGLPSGRGLNLAGRTRNLSELIELLSRGQVLVTIDSGPAHFSGLTPIARIVLFGPETPALYAPIGEHVDVAFTNLPCSPCYSAANHRSSPCTDNQCLKRITPADIAARVQRALGAAA